MSTLEISGLISIRDAGDTTDALFVSDSNDPLAERLEDLSGKQVSVRYWLSDVELEKQKLLMQSFLLLNGMADVRYNPRYSEITGYLWTDEDLNIGGHDLLERLKSANGKWLLLEIEVHEP